jgi:cytochrome c peroxidase
MFSDFEEHVIGVPQIAPEFGAGKGNVIFAGPDKNEDFGLEEITGDQADRYKFRTAPLRNLAVSPGFFHNGAFIELEDAVRFHVDVVKGARTYDPVKAGVPADLASRVGPAVPKRLLDPLVQKAIRLGDRELGDLVAFIRTGLLDARVNATNLCQLVPARVPSGLPVMNFETCP